MHKRLWVWEHLIGRASQSRIEGLLDCLKNEEEKINMIEQSSEATEPRKCASAIAIPGLRTKEALARFAGDTQRYRHWLAEFIDHGPAATAQVREAMTKGTQEAALNLVHTLKGRAGMLGMEEIHSVALSLEASLRSHEPTAFWLEELERTVAEMSERLASTLGKPHKLN